MREYNYTPEYFEDAYFREYTRNAVFVRQAVEHLFQGKLSVKQVKSEIAKLVALALKHSDSFDDWLIGNRFTAHPSLIKAGVVTDKTPIDLVWREDALRKIFAMRFKREWRAALDRIVGKLASEDRLLKSRLLAATSLNDALSIVEDFARKVVSGTPSLAAAGVSEQDVCDSVGEWVERLHAN